VLKTTVYLSEEEASGLRRLAAATGRSQSELIREGVRHVVSRPPRRTFHSMGVAEGPPYEPWDAAELFDRAMGHPTHPNRPTRRGESAPRTKTPPPRVRRRQPTVAGARSRPA
jgi:hypothetical protein